MVSAMKPSLVLAGCGKLLAHAPIYLMSALLDVCSCSCHEGIAVVVREGEDSPLEPAKDEVEDGEEGDECREELEVGAEPWPLPEGERALTGFPAFLK